MTKSTHLLAFAFLLTLIGIGLSSTFSGGGSYISLIVFFIAFIVGLSSFRHYGQ